MILIGHPYIPFSAFERIALKEDIASTSPQSTLLLDFHPEHVELCHYLVENKISFALVVKETKEVILSAALGADFIVCDKPLVTRAQAFADDYLFDAKILLQSENESDIDYAAEHGIDGILFPKGVKDEDRSH